MAMPFTFDDRNKLMYVERLSPSYMDQINIPEEYEHLLLPFTGKYLEQDKQWDILSQHRQAGPFSLWVQDVFTHADVVLCPYTPYHIWSLHFMFDISLRVKLYSNLSFSLEKGECNLFNLCSALHQVPMPAGMHMLSCHINILPAAFRGLAQHFFVFNKLARRTPGRITGPLNKTAYPIGRISELLLRSILTCTYAKEEQSHYFIQRCCLDLLICFCYQDAQADQPLVFENAMNADLFQQLFSYLVTHAHLHHSAEELGEIFSMDVKTLRFGFRQHFSMSLTNFLQMQRMMLVYELLAGGESQQNAAHVAGFRRVSEMRRRFEWYYGCKPGLLRKDW